jgi:hypothetical protein
VRRRLGRVEERLAGPHIIDVIDPQVRMLEQVRGLRVDLKRIFLVQQVQIEPLAAHSMIVLQTTTALYALATTIGTPAEHAESIMRHTLRFLAVITTADEVIAAWS